MNELGNSPADKDYKPSGFSRAEEAALKAYPDDRFISAEYASMCRDFFQEGYEQAEKDLALTWEDIKTIVDLYKSTMSNPSVLQWGYGSDIHYETVLKAYQKTKK